MPANDFFVPGLLALSGLLSNRNETTRQTSTQSPTQSPQVEAMRNSLLQQYQNLIGQTDPNGQNGLTAQTLADINHAYAIRKQQTIERLATNGISGPAAEAALNALDSERFSAITKARQSGTFQAANLRAGLMNQAGAFATNSPTTITSNASTTTPGQPFAQAFGNVADFIAHQYGQQYARNNPGLPTNIATPPTFGAGGYPTSGPSIIGSNGQAPQNSPQMPDYLGGLEQVGTGIYHGLRKVFGF